MSLSLRSLAAALILGLTTITAADAATTGAVRNLPGSNTLLANDDKSSPAVALGFVANFFSATSSTVYVNNNGNVTFSRASDAFTPSGLAGAGQPIIAPFFADVDTRYYGAQVTYGATTFEGRNAFVVNWLDVGYFKGGSAGTSTNSFQLLLVDRSNTGAGNFDIEFNYDNVAWETGTHYTSGGDANGLGGKSAYVGFSNGTTTEQFQGSGTPGSFLNGGSNALVSNSNVGFAGRYVFTVRNGQITNPPSAVPVPATLPLLLAGPGVLAFLRRRPRKS